jgi:hypothetical protein
MKIRPRDPNRGETVFLRRPKHRDPETRRSLASSPFEGRPEKSAIVSHRPRSQDSRPATRIPSFRPQTPCVAANRWRKEGGGRGGHAPARRLAYARVPFERIADSSDSNETDDAQTTRMRQTLHRRRARGWQAIFRSCPVDQVARGLHGLELRTGASLSLRTNVSNDLRRFAAPRGGDRRWRSFGRLSKRGTRRARAGHDRGVKH